VSYDEGGRVGIKARNPATQSAFGETVVTDSEWHHVVGVFASATNRRLYVDGVSEASDTTSASYSSDVDRWTIGRWGDSTPKSYFKGVIDEVSLYGTALSAEEVEKLYNETKPEDGGVVSIWHLNENSGATAYDSADGNDGEISGATWCAGVNGSALLFNGYDDHVSVADNGNLDISSEGTIEAWINAKTHKKYAGIVHKGAKKDFSDEAYSLQFWDPGILRVALFATPTEYLTVDSTDALGTDQWYYVVATWNSSIVYLYINGEENNSGSNTIGSVRATDGSLQIGAQLTELYSSSYGYFGFDGTVDEVAVYDVMLTPAEIKARYDANKPEDGGGVISIWHFNKNAGSTAYDSADGNDGKISGATWCAGVSESALLFNGVDDYVLVPESKNLTGMNELTIEAWVNLDELGGVYRDVVGKDSQYKLRLSPSGEAYKLSGVLYLEGGYNSITADSVDNIDTTGEWYYLVFTYNGSHTGLYINGELKKTAKAEGSVQPNSKDLTIGGKPSAKHTVGGIVDEVAVYDTALSPAEIRARYDAMKPVEGVVSIWHLNEDSGATAYDSADGNDGKITGATWTAGVNGSALEFDGKDDKVEINNNDNLDMKTITVEAWIKPRNLNTFGWKTFVDKNNFINWGWTFLHSYEFHDGRWDNYLITNINGDHVRSKQAVVEDEWQYVAFTYNSTHLNIYYNGCEVYSGEKEYDLSSGEKLVIGAGNIGNYYDGTIDEVSIYDRALTADEILECYNATKPEESAAISEWNMDEGSGEIAYDSADGNDGKISGATWTTGVVGSALSFDGKNDYVLVPNSENLNPLDGITIEAWASTAEHATSKVVDKGDWKGYDIALDKHKGWKAGVYIDGEKYKVGWSGKKPVIDRWYHIVLTYDGSAVTMYVDGVKEDTESASGSLKSNSNDLSIGSVGGKDKFFSGRIDEVSVYGEALTPEEIKERYGSVKLRSVKSESVKSEK
jgi:hypothetical protein